MLKILKDLHSFALRSGTVDEWPVKLKTSTVTCSPCFFLRIKSITFYIAKLALKKTQKFFQKNCEAVILEVWDD